MCASNERLRTLLKTNSLLTIIGNVFVVLLSVGLILGNFTFQKYGNGDAMGQAFNLQILNEGIAMFYAVSGLAILVSIAGVFGTVFKLRDFMLVYVCSTMLSLMVFVLSLSVFLGALMSMLENLESFLFISMWSYNGLSGTNVDSIAWNYLQSALETCGVNSYKDWANMTYNQTGILLTVLL